MDVLNAAGVSPISLAKHPDRKKSFPFKFPKPTTSESLALRFGSGLALLNLSYSAKALTYEEALGQQIVGSSSFDFDIWQQIVGSSSSDFDIGQLLDEVIKFAVENPAIVAGGTIGLALPLILSLVFKGSKAWGIESAKIAYSKLAGEGETQLLDIRERKDFNEVGIPDLRSLKKKAVLINYREDDKPAFLKKLALRFKDPANTTLFVLDKFDGNSKLVAELVTANGFKAAYAIKDGVEGPRGWLKSGLPWSPPKKGINIDFSNLTDAISSAVGEDIDGLPVALGLAAASGLSLLAFSEIESVLQLLGSAALVQFITKKLLFAEDRKVTLKQMDEFFNTKVAPKELANEIKTIGKALLPVSTVSALASSSQQENPIVSDTKVVNSVPTEIEEESPPAPPRPQYLSPYPSYPDFKPPSSPSPSPP
ncbi:rhodanese-like domain-containing protein 4, chloroplastic [Dioscorea cayenensis subsp. rotundata]|uniref:Protein THYLAKOID RHODANESE-LIKE, chloroplastic n=1 Tax=Dioscorea cayennensis subsp. rotundata TaxID=55577 RepID=A0AB40CU43_DIOCR|nr:rhodanese-like domain-containing protein 4, chloroplastic [Dioscorea cayenensis subsp. rotundata]